MDPVNSKSLNTAQNLQRRISNLFLLFSASFVYLLFFKLLSPSYLLRCESVRGKIWRVWVYDWAYTWGDRHRDCRRDRRRDEHLFNWATNWRSSRRRSPVVYIHGAIVATIAATIAPTGCSDDCPVYTAYKIRLAVKSAVNLSAEIQPKNMWLAEFSAKFLLSQPKLNKKFGWGVYTKHAKCGATIFWRHWVITFYVQGRP